MHRAELRVEAVDGVRVSLDLGDDVDRLLREQLDERGLDEVADRGEVVEQRGPLHSERQGEPLGREADALALEDGHRAAREVEAFLVIGSPGHN